MKTRNNNKNDQSLLLLLSISFCVFFFGEFGISENIENEQAQNNVYTAYYL